MTPGWKFKLPQISDLKLLGFLFPAWSFSWGLPSPGRETALGGSFAGEGPTGPLKSIPYGMVRFAPLRPLHWRVLAGSECAKCLVLLKTCSFLRALETRRKSIILHNMMGSEAIILQRQFIVFKKMYFRHGGFSARLRSMKKRHEIDAFNRGNASRKTLTKLAKNC